MHHEHPSYKWWVLANIMIGTFMTALNTTIVNTCLPKMMASLGISIDEAQWIVTAYMLAFAVMLPSSGWLADRFGYKRTYAAGLAVFTAFSLLCAVSPNHHALIVMRIFQGLGGGLMQPLGMAIVLREFPPRQRGLAMGLWTVAAAASLSFGPMMGGVLSDNFDWHLIFTINVPVGIMCLFATWVIQREYRKQQGHPFDIFGFLSMVMFLSFFLLALSSGDARWNAGGWTSDFMMVCYTLSSIGLVIFLVTELNVEHPLVKIKLLGTLNFGLTNLTLFTFGIGQFGSTFLLPLYLQNALGYTALQSGMSFLPMGISQALCSVISGYLSDKVNAKIPIVFGTILLTLTFCLNSGLSLFSENTQIMLPIYLRGIAMGFLFSPLTALAVARIAQKDMAQASGLTNVIRQIGGSFGVAILQTLLSSRSTFHSVISGSTIDRASPVFENSMRLLQIHAIHDAGSCFKDSPIQSSMIFSSHFNQQMYVWGIDDAFLVCAICTALCVVPILILKTAKERSNQ